MITLLPLRWFSQSLQMRHSYSRDSPGSLVEDILPFPSVTSAEVRRAQTKSQQLVVQPCVGAWPCRLSPCELSKGSATQHTTHLPCLHCNLFRSCDKWAWRLCRCPPPHWRCRCTPARWGLACSARPSHYFLPANVTVRSVTSQQLLPSQWVAGDSVSGGELLLFSSAPLSVSCRSGVSIFQSYKCTKFLVKQSIDLYHTTHFLYSVRLKN